MKRSVSLLLPFAIFLLVSSIARAQTTGTTVTYQLPTTGPLPQTYTVTLAATDPNNPDWIVSTFLAGQARTVTAENQGKFTEKWDGLDDNFMPLPPGQYGIKGIYMPAKKWAIDGEYHAITPKYFTTASAWRALPGESKSEILSGDPVNSPIGDVDVAANGIGTFCYSYLENARNFYVVDFKKPINYDQVLGSGPSGGAAGGNNIATDGSLSWCYDYSGFIFRTDGKPFGKDSGKYRTGVYMPKGTVKSMAAWRDEAAAKSFLYVAQKAGKEPDSRDQIVVLNGENSQVLATLPVADPMAVVARWGNRLWVMHNSGADTIVSAVDLNAGLPTGDLKPVLTVPATIKPTDLEVDSHNRIYLADAAANHVYQISPTGKTLLRFGKLDAQPSGGYDPLSFMYPEKLSCWRDAEGRDHLIVVEKYGPDRVSEWNPEDGTLQREWLSAQTFANFGYAVDPRNPSKFYIEGHGGYMMRYGVDYTSGAWKLEATWPNVNVGRFGGTRSFMQMLYHGDTRYLAWPRGNFIFREEGNRWVPSAAIITEGRGKEAKDYLWHDANGNGAVDPDEYQPNLTPRPMNTEGYWGNTWLDDFSYVAIQRGGPDVYRLAVDSWDAHGNPVYKTDGWTKLFTDPILKARAENKATALYGANEMGTGFSSAWALVAGDMKNGFWLNARGPDVSANLGAQQKLSRLVPDGKGGYTMKWRVGRMATHGAADTGEIYGSIHVMPPIGGLITQIDQSRMGVALYNEDGLYVDTLFPDERRVNKAAAGVYSLPGEFFTGYSYVNPANNKVYLALGKTTPMVFEVEGWTANSNPVQPLTTAQKSVALLASNIAPAPEFALNLRRGGKATDQARIARFTPLPGGGPALDGTMTGWEACETLTFSGGDKQDIDVRCGYDQQNLYLRWHARLGRKVDVKPLAPADRLFTHDRLADTLSFYIQGDPNAKPAKGTEARPGDLRVVLGLFNDNGQTKPVALGMYPKWNGPEKGVPLTYKTAAGGAAVFEHVGLLPDAKLGYALDPDGQGFTIAAAIPQARVPMFPAISGAFRTMVNFDATYGGHNRFWWSNADGSASRETYDEPTEARLYPGSWSQAQFEPMTELPIRTWNVIGPFGFEKYSQLDTGPGRNTLTKILSTSSFPPEEKLDLAATYEGDMTTTRQAKRKLTWKSVNIIGDQIDFTDALKWKGFNDEGTIYMATWVYAPAATEVKLKERDAHGHHALRGWLNDTPLPVQLPKGQNAAMLHHELNPDMPVTLQAGWNKMLFRFDRIWGENSVGVVIDAAPEKLWTLKFSNQPPAP